MTHIAQASTAIDVTMNLTVTDGEAGVSTHSSSFCISEKTLSAAKDVTVNLALLNIYDSIFVHEAALAAAIDGALDGRSCRRSGDGIYVNSLSAYDHIGLGGTAQRLNVLKIISFSGKILPDISGILHSILIYIIIPLRIYFVVWMGSRIIIHHTLASVGRAYRIIISRQNTLTGTKDIA